MPDTSPSPDVYPAWLFHALPANAVVDPKFNQQVASFCTELPKSLSQLNIFLREAEMQASLEPALNIVAKALWEIFPKITQSDSNTKSSYTSLVINFMTNEFVARVCRAFAKDANEYLRQLVAGAIASGRIHEVALPARKNQPWTPLGWLKGTTNVPLGRHKTGKKAVKKLGLPHFNNLAELREALGISSPEQLGYFLLATDAKNGPYHTFTIPKRNGQSRIICAPKAQLKWVQRRIYEKILLKLPAHHAAHGFIVGRSTATNAEQHLGAEMVLKFDLKDFFPTIHFYRVLGLFTSLGYPAGNAKFKTNDQETQRIAPVLARLCCYTPDPETWGTSYMPQGAATSPAISNLVCRCLDSRLTGLAKNVGGVYTRYADDLTFSFREKQPEVGRFRWWVDQICQQEGFAVNQSKFRVVRRSQRQMVTGIVVNDSLRIPREDRRRFRAILFNCERDGIASQSRGRPGFASYLRGFASYVNMVHPEEGAELLTQVSKLLGENEAEA